MGWLDGSGGAHDKLSGVVPLHIKICGHLDPLNQAYQWLP